MSNKSFLNQDEETENKKKRAEQVTQIISLIIAFISVFIFFFKLLFF
jgi:hypothetical protein